MAPTPPRSRNAPYVILVSLDGFRYDYPEKYGAPNLVALGKRGASAPHGMIPAYPSSTFPNHLSIITGLYPEHHGIVANSFYDPARKDRFTYTDPAKSGDGSWYSGVPLWSLAEQQGMRSACFFWPASDAEIAGERPSFYLHYDSHIPNDRRVTRPSRGCTCPKPSARISSLCTSATSTAPAMNSAQTAKRPATPCIMVDGIVGNLEAELKQTSLAIDLIVVADHGMEKVQGDWIDLDRYADLSDFEPSGPLLYPKSEEAAEKAYEKLRGASDKFTVYRRSNVPPDLHYDSNPRIGDPVVIANGPYLDPRARRRKSRHAARLEGPARLRSLSHEDDARDFLRRRPGHPPGRDSRTVRKREYLSADRQNSRIADRRDRRQFESLAGSSANKTARGGCRFEELDASWVSAYSEGFDELRWRWSFRASERSVSGIFLFVASSFMSAPVRRTISRSEMSRGVFGLYVRLRATM